MKLSKILKKSASAQTQEELDKWIAQQEIKRAMRTKKMFRKM